MKPYRDDLAYIHDSGFSDFARNSAPGLLRILSQNGLTKGLVIDLGCGSGIWAAQLHRNGYDVVGVDLSEAMIKMARRRVPAARFIKGSLLKVTPPPCAVVTSLGECMNYLFDETNSLEQIRGLFQRIYKALDPGGLFIFDIAEPGRGKGPQQKHLQSRDWAVLVDVDEDHRTNRLTRRITSFRKAGARFRRDEEVHNLQLYRRSEILKELREIGFRVRTLSSYGEQAMIPGCVGFLARKPISRIRKKQPA